MSKVFYDHLILLEDIALELSKYDLDPLDRDELVNLADQNLHHHTLNIILTHLPAEHHATFLDLLKTAPHDPALLSFLKKEIKADIEQLIKDQTAKIKKEILAEIKKSQVKK